MTPTKLLIGQIFVVFAIVLAGVWFATQWSAAALAYQPELGQPWFTLFGRPIYAPWALFPWWFSFEAYAPVIFEKAGAMAAASGLVGCAAAIFGSIWRARQRNNLTTYGSARWASAKDIRAAGLLTEAGVFLGRTGPHYLRHNGPEHIMAFAPTRSGKGIGLVVPTLLGWSGSAVIHDIKGENWQLTAGWRQRFSHCLLFNPTDARSARYNPLLEVRRGIEEVRDVQNIADILVDPEGALERRSHWEKTSHSLLVGAILHILYAEEEKTLARVASFLSDPQRPFTATLRRMMMTNHLGTVEAPVVHPVVASAAREVLNKSENERSGVLSTAMSFLGLYRDPTVATVTSRCDWRIADFVEGRSPVSLYLVVPPSDISRTKPLIRLVLNQIGRRLTEHLHAANGANAAAKHKLLMMLDEFPALGRLDFFETSLAFLAGYGVRAFLIAQSLNQIEKAYGEHNARHERLAPHAPSTPSTPVPMVRTVIGLATSSWTSEMRSEKIRHQLFLPKPVSDRLEALAAKPGASKSAILTDAVTAWLNRRGASELEDRFGIRLDRLTAAIGRLERDGHIQLETLALFIRYELAIQAPLAENDHAGRAIAAKRFDAFIAQVGRQIAAGRRTIADGFGGAAESGR